MNVEWTKAQVFRTANSPSIAEPTTPPIDASVIRHDYVSVRPFQIEQLILRSKSKHASWGGVEDSRYAQAMLKEIESLMSAKADTPEGDRLDVLVTLVEAYERAHFPMDLLMP